MLLGPGLGEADRRDGAQVRALLADEGPSKSLRLDWQKTSIHRDRKCSCRAGWQDVEREAWFAERKALQCEKCCWSTFVHTASRVRPRQSSTTLSCRRMAGRHREGSCSCGELGVGLQGRRLVILRARGSSDQVLPVHSNNLRKLFEAVIHQSWVFDVLTDF